MGNIIGIKNFINLPKKSEQNQVEQGLNYYQSRGFTSSVSDFGTCVFGYSAKNNADYPIYDASNKYALVLDGKIYNYQDLKNDLLKKGVTFQTSSDAEVLLYHLIEFGTKGIQQLNGSFAFSFYDSHEDELLIVRDHFGQKPMLFSIQDEMLVFASELMPFKYILEDWSINQNALNAYFQFTYIPAPDTMIQEVQKLLPGHYLSVKGKNFDLVQYYTPDTQIKEGLTIEAATERLKIKLEDAVIRRLDNPQETETFLSGGVDSSIISLLTSNFKDDLQTFSIGYKENSFFDETEYSQKVAESIGSYHQILKLAEEDFKESFQDILNSFDEPFADSSAVALYFLTRYAGEKASVFLSGDGADEIFAGYHKHRAYLMSKEGGGMLKMALKTVRLLPEGSRNNKISNKVRQLKKLGGLFEEKWPEKYWMLAQFISKEMREGILLNPLDYKSYVQPGDDNLNDFLLMDQKFILPYDMLKKVDLMSRRHGVEIVSPFMDKEVVEFGNSLKADFKRVGKQGKIILKEAFGEELPEIVFSRSKRGFEIPLFAWISSIFEDIIEKPWWQEEFLTKQNLFSAENIRHLKKNFEHGKQDDTVTMWAYIVFQNWYSNWIER